MIKNTFDISDFVPAPSLTGTVYELVKREKAARKAKKLTQKQLAERTGVSRAHGRELWFDTQV